MNKLTHLKRFNESGENLNISDVSDSENIKIFKEGNVKLEIFNEEENTTTLKITRGMNKLQFTTDNVNVQDIIDALRSGI